jgi:probable phosphoglycerate mutase
VSRARFWGTPLPIWESESGKKLILGSIEELRKHTNRQITKIIFVRHGQAEHNVLEMSSSALDKHPLTKLGEEQAKKAAEKLQSEDIDVVYASPILRAKQTAEAYTKRAGKEIIFDDRLKEITSGNWEETTQFDPAVKNERDAYKNLPVEERYVFKRGETGESWKDLDERTQDFLNEVVAKHPGKTIAVFSHQGTGSSMIKILKGLSNQQAVASVFHNASITGNAIPTDLYIDNKRMKELDLHRPYIDEFHVQKDNESYKRIPDVLANSPKRARSVRRSSTGVRSSLKSPE